MEESHEISHAGKKSFLAAYAETGSVTVSAKAADVDRRTHYDWLENDEEYAKAFEDAKAEAAEALETEARRRAVLGVHRMKFWQGMPILVPCNAGDEGAVDVGEPGKPSFAKPYIEHEYSDSLLLKLLSANNREKFGDQSSLKVDGNLNSTITIFRLPDNGRDNPDADDDPDD